MGTIVIARQRILHDQLQEKGSVFEIDDADLERLKAGNYITLLPEEDLPLLSATKLKKEEKEDIKEIEVADFKTIDEPIERIIADYEKPIVDPEEESEKPIDNPSGESEEIAEPIGTTAKSGQKADVETLIALEKELEERKKTIFADENELFDREKGLQLRKQALARKEEKLAVQIKETEMRLGRINGKSDRSSAPGVQKMKRPLVR